MTVDHAPRALRLYLAIIGVAAVGLAAASVGALPGILADLEVPGGASPYLLGLPIAGFVAELAPARLRSSLSVSLVTVVIFTGLLIGGWSAAVLVAIGAAGAVAIRTSERRLQRTVFNAGQLTVAAFAAGVVFEYFGGTPGDVTSLLSGGGVVGLVLTSLTLTVVNLSLISVILWCVTGDDPVRSFFSFAKSAATLQLVYVFFAVIAAHLVLVVSPLALVVLLVPLMVARAGLLGFQEQDEATDRMVKAFVKALEVKDGYTRGHAERVAALTEKVAAEMGFSYDERRMAGYAALLHDIGKIGVPTAVITKRGPLDDEEFAAIKRHPTVGAEMLRDIDFLVPALDVVRHHHERYDGRGYPYGLAGERIPPLARMVSVVDAFDAMTSTRSYRKALPVEVALRELDRCAGTQFDVDAVKALHRVIAREGWELTTDPVGEVVSRAGQVRALAREVVSEAAG